MYVCIYMYACTHLDLDTQTHASRAVGVPLKHGTVRAAKKKYTNGYENIYTNMHFELYVHAHEYACTRLSRCRHAIQAWHSARGVEKSIHRYVCMYIYTYTCTYTFRFRYTDARRSHRGCASQARHGASSETKYTKMYEQIYQYAFRIIPAGTRLSRCGHATQAWHGARSDANIYTNMYIVVYRYPYICISVQRICMHTPLALWSCYSGMARCEGCWKKYTQIRMYVYIYI